MSKEEENNKKRLTEVAFKLYQIGEALVEEGVERKLPTFKTIGTSLSMCSQILDKPDAVRRYNQIISYYTANETLIEVLKGPFGVQVFETHFGGDADDLDDFIKECENT